MERCQLKYWHGAGATAAGWHLWGWAGGKGTGRGVWGQAGDMGTCGGCSAGCPVTPCHAVPPIRGCHPGGSLSPEGHAVAPGAAWVP